MRNVCLIKKHVRFLLLHLFVKVLLPTGVAVYVHMVMAKCFRTPSTSEFEFSELVPLLFSVRKFHTVRTPSFFCCWTRIGVQWSTFLDTQNVHHRLNDRSLHSISILVSSLHVGLDEFVGESPQKVVGAHLLGRIHFVPQSLHVRSHCV